MTKHNPLLRFLLAVSSSIFLSACAAGERIPTSVVEMPGSREASIQAAPVAGSKIPDRYIVVFRDEVADPAAEAAGAMRGRGGQIHFTYTHALKGFAATIPAPALEGIARNPRVAYIEPDAVVTADAITAQSDATWGIDRIDQRDLPLNKAYAYGTTGSGINAYVIDTGILYGHSEFGGRVSPGYSAIGGDATDCNGHGTHVAGTIGGGTYGVAKGVTLIPVRVLNCSGSGTTSGVIAGIDYVAKSNTSVTRVANMSLGGGASSALDQAVSTAVNAGVVMVVAAGNSKRDACSFSPARAPSAITVGATTSTDARASYSNYGPCLDLFAPGSSITSAWYTSSTAINTISGTSMATPHVTGAAALILAKTPTMTPAQVAASLVGDATPNKVTSAGKGSPNLLLFTNPQ